MPGGAAIPSVSSPKRSSILKAAAALNCSKPSESFSSTLSLQPQTEICPIRTSFFLALKRAERACVALETSRGWRIAKEKQSHKIDRVIGLAQAALGAIQQGQTPSKIEWASAK